VLSSILFTWPLCLRYCAFPRSVNYPAISLLHSANLFFFGIGIFRFGSEEVFSVTLSFLTWYEHRASLSFELATPGTAITCTFPSRPLRFFPPVRNLRITSHACFCQEMKFPTPPPLLCTRRLSLRGGTSVPPHSDCDDAFSV